MKSEIEMLKDAIKECEDIASKLENGCSITTKTCGSEHKQIASWLKYLLIAKLHNKSISVLKGPMTLDSAIEHCIDNIKNNKQPNKHRQLLRWLEEVEQYQSHNLIYKNSDMYFDI